MPPTPMTVRVDWPTNYTPPGGETQIIMLSRVTDGQGGYIGPLVVTQGANETDAEFWDRVASETATLQETWPKVALPPE